MKTRERAWAQAMAAGRRGSSTIYERLLAEIADSLRPLVRSKLRRCGLGDAEAEDVVQEVLVAIHTKRHTWDEDRPFVPWLNAIAHHKLVDAVRRLAREARKHREITDDEWENLFEAPAPDQDRRSVDLERHVRALPARQRDVLAALVLEGASVKTVAARLKTSEGVIRMTFHRALAAVRQALHPRSVTPRKGAAHADEDTCLEEDAR